MEINFLAVILSGLAFFLVGGIWYGPLFGKAWQAENKLTDQDLATRNMALVFGLAFLLALFSAFNLAMFLGKDPSLELILTATIGTGVGFIATAFGIVYLFEKKSLKLFLINAGYFVVAYLVMGAIFWLL